MSERALAYGKCNSSAAGIFRGRLPGLSGGRTVRPQQNGVSVSCS